MRSRLKEWIMGKATVAGEAMPAALAVNVAAPIPLPARKRY